MKFIGAHSIIYSRNPEADRTFIKTVLGFPHVDVGDRWLIFALPPAELAVHPAEDNSHELYLMCDRIDEFVSEMNKRGIICGAIETQPWGSLTRIVLPGGGKLGVYQPRHARPNPRHSKGKKKAVRRSVRKSTR